MQSPASLGRPRLALVRGTSLAEADDAALARAVIDGHAGAPGVVWDRYATLVRRVLRRAMGPSADVEDQVQETFLRYFKDAGAVREGSALRAFLFGVAVRVAREELRRRRVRRWFSLTKEGDVPDVRAEAADEVAREAVRRLYQVLDDQGDEARLAFVLRHVEGLELQEVAAALSVSLATVKRLLAKVEARVRAVAARDPILSSYVDASEVAP